MSAPTPIVRPLAAKQAEVYTWIFEQTALHGYQPTYREAMVVFGYTSATAILANIRALRRKGYIGIKDRGKSRRIQFLVRPDGFPFKGFVPR